jgi:hypothetical protein
VTVPVRNRFRITGDPSSQYLNLCCESAQFGSLVVQVGGSGSIPELTDSKQTVRFGSVSFITNLSCDGSVQAVPNQTQFMDISDQGRFRFRTVPVRDGSGSCVIQVLVRVRFWFVLGCTFFVSILLCRFVAFPFALGAALIYTDMTYS